MIVLGSIPIARSALQLASGHVGTRDWDQDIDPLWESLGNTRRIEACLIYRGIPTLPQHSHVQSHAATAIGSLTRGLLVIVSPEIGNPTETPRLLCRLVSTGRLSVDVEVVPAVDQHKAQNRPQRAVTTMWMRASQAIKQPDPRSCVQVPGDIPSPGSLAAASPTSAATPGDRCRRNR